MKKVVVIGGGTGNYVVLSGLKDYDLNITAVVSMADDGGSTGILRDEMGALPPGDVRQCLVALSASSKELRDLFNYRFESGGLAGHNFGNLFLSALEKVAGSFEKAVEEAGRILCCKGKVLPVTCDEVVLRADLGNGKVIKGQVNIDKVGMYKYPEKRLFISPKAKVNPKAAKAIKEADIVVIAPGSLYSSLLPNLLVEGVPIALQKTRAKILYICNLVNKPNETAGYTVCDYVMELEKAGGRKIDYVLYNTKKPINKVLEKYIGQNELLVGECRASSNYEIIEEDILKDAVMSQKKGDLMNRSFIRHDSEKVASVIIKILGK